MGTEINPVPDFRHCGIVTECIEHAAKRNPQKIAVTFLDRNLTYAELERRANKLANHLLETGIRKNDSVGIWMERSEQYIVAILGIQKAGGVYVPMDMNHPVDRNRFIIRDSDCRALVTDPGRECPPGIKLPLLTIQEGDGVSENAPDVTLSPEDPLYILYTSGSTGQPKGCLLTHYNVVQLMANGGSFFDFNSRDIWMLLNSFCFDVSVWEMYGALFAGGKLVVVSQEEIYDLSKLTERIIAERPTILNRAPAAFLALAREMLKKDHSYGDHLRYIIFAGDKLEFPHLAEWARRVPIDRTALINMY